MDDPLKTSMRSAGDLVSDHVADILNKWDHLVRQLLSDQYRQRSGPALRNNMPALLTHIAKALSDDKVQLPDDLLSAHSRTHVIDRLSDGSYSLAEMMQEYILLREATFGYLEPLAVLSERERDIVYRCTEQAMCKIATEYTDLIQKLQQGLDASDKRHRDLLRLGLQSLPVILYEQDTELRYIWAFPGDFGLSEDEIVGRKASDVLSAEDAQAVDAIKLRVLETGAPSQGEVSIRIHDTPAILAITVEPLLDADGSIRGVIGAEINVTNYRRDRDTVRRQKEQIEFILATANVGLWTWDATTGSGYISPTAKAHLGFTDGELGNSFADWLPRVHPDDLTRVNSLWAKVFEHKQANYEIEYRIRHKNDSYRYLLSRGGWLSPRNDQPSILMGVHLDVTNRKTVELEREDLARKLAAEHQQIQGILEHLPVGVAIADCGTGEMIYHNKAAEDLTAQPLSGTDRLEGFGQCGAMHSDGTKYRAEEYPILRAALNGEIIKGEEMIYCRGDGVTIHFAVSAARIEQPMAERNMAVCVFHDISDLKRAESALVREKELAEVTLRAIGDGVITTDKRGCVEQMNPAAERLTGWLEQDALGKPIVEVIQVKDERDHKPLELPVRTCLEGHGPMDLESHAFLVGKDGVEHPIHGTSAAIHNSENEVVGSVMILHDISEERRMAREMSHHAMHDALTGLVNRREFARRLHRAIEDVSHGSSSAALLYMDLDRFKLINDRCGHAAGDELLRQLTEVFSRHVRERDTLARLGGDEFAIILEHCNLEQAHRVADSLRLAVQEFRFFRDDQIFQVGISIGLVPIDHASADLEQVIAQADQACYVAKQGGRNQIHVIRNQDWIATAHAEEINWVRRLQDALRYDRMKLFAQSIVPLSEQSPPGERFEILLRLCNSDDSLLSPAAFLPAAERYDLMPEIDFWVVRKVLEWLGQQGVSLGQVQLCTVNLSARTVTNEATQQRMRGLLDQRSVPPGKICFEISESAAMSNQTKANRFIRDLRGMGYRFALDNFGTGMASFTYLKQLPADFLKIDGSFIEGIIDDSDNCAIVKSINEIGHIMGKQTIAEFVDREVLVDRLRDIGVDFAQGYHIAHPRQIERVF